MLENEIAVNQFQRGHLQLLISEVPDEKLAEQIVPGLNHPLWIIGHLAVSADSAVSLLGGEKVLPENWRALFGMGSTPTPNIEDYPGKAELLSALNERYEAVYQLAQETTVESLAGPNPHPRLRERVPTLGGLLCFLLTGHFAFHVGQCSAWRRTIGLPPLF